MKKILARMAWPVFIGLVILLFSQLNNGNTENAIDTSNEFEVEIEDLRRENQRLVDKIESLNGTNMSSGNKGDEAIESQGQIETTDEIVTQFVEGLAFYNNHQLRKKRDLLLASATQDIVDSLVEEGFVQMIETAIEENNQEMLQFYDMETRNELIDLELYQQVVGSEWVKYFVEMRYSIKNSTQNDIKETYLLIEVKKMGEGFKVTDYKMISL